MLHTLVVYVENKPGVLNRVVSLFRRRSFNIDSLTVGRTEKPDVSRMARKAGIHCEGWKSGRHSDLVSLGRKRVCDGHVHCRSVCAACA